MVEENTHLVGDVFEIANQQRLRDLLAAGKVEPLTPGEIRDLESLAARLRKDADDSQPS